CRKLPERDAYYRVPGDVEYFNPTIGSLRHLDVSGYRATRGIWRDSECKFFYSSLRYTSRTNSKAVQRQVNRSIIAKHTANRSSHTAHDCGRKCYVQENGISCVDRKRSCKRPMAKRATYHGKRVNRHAC